MHTAFLTTLPLLALVVGVTVLVTALLAHLHVTVENRPSSPSDEERPRHCTFNDSDYDDYEQYRVVDLRA